MFLFYFLEVPFSSYCSLFSAPTLRIISCFSWSNTSIKLSMFCLEYFVAGNLEHCKVSCHLGVRGGEAVLCSICCLAMFFRGCAALWSKLERLSIRESKKQAWKTTITAQRWVQRSWFLHDRGETPATRAIMCKRLNSAFQVQGIAWREQLDCMAWLCPFRSQTDPAQPGFLPFFLHHLRHFHSPSGGIRTRAQGGSMFPMGCIGTGGMEHPESSTAFHPGIVQRSRHGFPCARPSLWPIWAISWHILRERSP